MDTGIRESNTTQRQMPTFTIGCKCGEVLAYDGKELQCPKCYRKYDSLGQLIGREEEGMDKDQKQVIFYYFVKLCDARNNIVGVSQAISGHGIPNLETALEGAIANIEDALKCPIFDIC